MKCTLCSHVMVKGTLSLDNGIKYKVWFCWQCEKLIRRTMASYELRANQLLGKGKGGGNSEPQ